MKLKFPAVLSPLLEKLFAKLKKRSEVTGVARRTKTINLGLFSLEFEMKVKKETHDESKQNKTCNSRAQRRT